MKYYLTALAALLVLPAHAATTISTTLTMTSPTAIISMTGVSATAYLANIVGTTISTTNISASAITGPVNVALAKVYFNGLAGCAIVGTAYNVASCSRSATGTYGISFTTVLGTANYVVNCMTQSPALFASLASTPSATTAGFNIATANASTTQDSARVMCTVF